MFQMREGIRPYEYDVIETSVMVLVRTTETHPLKVTAPRLWRAGRCCFGFIINDISIISVKKYLNYSTSSSA